MSIIGNSLDNRPIEYWFGILKSELYYLKNLKMNNEEKIFYEIKYYNKEIIQSSIKNLSPNVHYETYKDRFEKIN